MSAPRKKLTAMPAGGKLVHIRSFDEPKKTFCGRISAAVNIARQLSTESTCRKCVEGLERARATDARIQVETRNRVEDRAKACFEILARESDYGQFNDVWEREEERTREAFRKIVRYMTDLCGEDSDEQFEKAGHA